MESEEGGLRGGLFSLKDTVLLTHYVEPGGTTFVDARNGFNELSCLTMLWTVRHHCLAGAMFAFNGYRHCVQLLLRQPRDAPFILLIRDFITQGELLLVLLYGITLVTLVEDLRDVDPTLLYPFYADDMVFDGLARRSVAQLLLLMDRSL